jgi:hypothetical protein
MEPIIHKIWKLEAMLHRIKGKSNKHQERKVIMAQLDKLSKQIREK